LQEPTKNVGTAETGKKVRFFFNAANWDGWENFNHYRNIYFCGWVNGRKPLWHPIFMSRDTNGMFCRILFISQLLMYVCNEECQEKISPIQSYFNNFSTFPAAGCFVFQQ